MKRVLSLLVVLAMLLCVVPSAFAAEEDLTWEIAGDAIMEVEAVDAAEIGFDATKLYDIGDHEYDETEPNDSTSQAGLLKHDYTVSGKVGGYDLDLFKIKLSATADIFTIMMAARKGPICAIFDSTLDNALCVATSEYDDGYYYDYLSCTLNSGTYYLVILDQDAKTSTSYVFYFECVTSSGGGNTHTHSYTSVVTAPTCGADGYTTYTCSCGDSYVADAVPATGAHVFDNDQDAQCNVCGYVREIHVHAYVPTVITEANCLAQGLTIYTCACGHSYTETVAAQGHVYSDYVDPTCDVCGAERIVNHERPTHSMYRMYNPNSGEHFYTGSMEERQNLVNAGWKYEGVGFTFPVSTGDPVYRLYDKFNTTEHLYTMDVNEMSTLLAQGWVYEGIAFNSGYTTEVPQYRLHNPNATVGAYHFTASEAERDTLIAAGWEYQGIGWYSCWQ